MKRFLFILIILSFGFCFAQEDESLVGETSEEFNNEETYNDEPVTNEDKVAENEGKEVNAAPAPKKEAAPKSGNKFNQFVNRSGKKALVGAKFGLELWHGKGWVWAGGHFDLFMEYNFVKNFGLQVELDFRGGRNWGSFTIPVIAQANIPITDMFWLNAGAGLWFSVNWWGGVDGGLIAKTALEINTKIGVFVADFRYTPSFRSPYRGAFAILAGYAVPLPF